MRLLSGPSKGGFKASCSLTISRNHKTKKFVPFVLTAQCLDEAPILWLLLGASKIGVLRSSDLTLVMDFPGGTSSILTVFFCPYLLTPPPPFANIFRLPPDRHFIFSARKKMGDGSVLRKGRRNKLWLREPTINADWGSAKQNKTRRIPTTKGKKMFFPPA